MLKPMLRSTPFRLVLMLGGAFLVALGIAAALAFNLIREDLFARIDRDIADTYAIIEQSFHENDLADLSDLVASHVRATVGLNEIYLLQAEDGTMVAGNISQKPGHDGWQTLSAEALGLPPSQDEFRIYSGQLGTNTLVVGVNLSETNAVGWVVLTALGWTVGGLAIVILLIGALAAIGGQRRLDAIAETMERISRGELNARIPRTGRNDDIDALVASVNAALDRLAALVEGMRQVSVDIAHELKTPLNRLSIAVTSAIEMAEEKREVLPLLDEAQQEIGQVIAIFDAMLRIAQIESGARKARFGSVALRPVLDSVFDAYDLVAADKGQTLALKVEDELGSISGDRDLLTQAIANLIENAIRHCPEGAEICLGGRLVGGQAELVVADNGPGIPDADKLRVFDRLYRVEKSRTTPGNGLGLSLVKAIVELHGATVVLQDNQPGLKVIIRFPQIV